MNILIDTNIALYLLGGDSRIAEVLEGQIVHVSFVTELELLGYPQLNKKEEKLIHDFLEDCVIIDVNKRIKDFTIAFLKKYKLKIPDGIIAATSAYLGIPLMSADRDFVVVEEINFLMYEET
jgi:predicted nucleic acid-binding protein